MKRPARRGKSAAQFSDSTQRRLTTYALMASSAAVGCLALAKPLEAEIVYTPVGVLIPSNGVHSYNLDLNGDGLTDFTITEFFFGDSDLAIASLYVAPVAGNGVMASHQNVVEALALFHGQTIGSSRRFVPKKARLLEHGSSGGGIYTGGNWQQSNPRFLGLSFQIDGETHYGWARLIVKRNNFRITAYLSGYAYETVPNMPIDAGSTVGPQAESFSPEPGSLGALAAGATGRVAKQN